MKRLTIGLTLSIAATALLLTGCGGSSSSSSSGSTAVAQTGYFVDSAVANINYDCVADGDFNKTTDANGSFSCVDMSNVRFHIGDLELGTIGALPQDGYVYPQDLVGTLRTDVSNAQVVAIAKLLQGLDADKNPANGIEIQEIAKQKIQEHEFKKFDATELGQYAAALEIELPDESEAKAHLEDTLKKHQEQEQQIQEEVKKKVDEKVKEYTETKTDTSNHSNDTTETNDNNTTESHS